MLLTKRWRFGQGSLDQNSSGSVRTSCLPYFLPPPDLNTLRSVSSRSGCGSRATAKSSQFEELPCWAPSQWCMESFKEWFISVLQNLGPGLCSSSRVYLPSCSYDITDCNVPFIIIIFCFVSDNKKKKKTEIKRKPMPGKPF